MSQKVPVVACVVACLLWLPALASAGVVLDTATSPPDTPASVNADPNGVAQTPTRTRVLGISPAYTSDPHGCPSGYGCGWVDGSFGTPMGRWGGNNSNLSVFSQQACSKYHNWNDCISSIANNGTSGCNINWWQNAGYGGNDWSERVGFNYGDIGSSNDSFSSDSWCST